jgi:hypothetical protein
MSRGYMRRITVVVWSSTVFFVAFVENDQFMFSVLFLVGLFGISSMWIFFCCFLEFSFDFGQDTVKKIFFQKFSIEK